MESESQNGLQEDLLNTGNGKDVASPYNLPAKSAEQIETGSTEFSTSHITGHVEASGMAAAHGLSTSSTVLIIDSQGDELEPQIDDNVETPSNGVPNTNELHSTIKNSHHEYSNSAEDKEQVNTEFAANDSPLEQQTYEPVESPPHVNSLTETVENELENSKGVVNKHSAWNYEGIWEEDAAFNIHQESLQFEDDKPPPDQIEERDPQIETQTEEQGAINADDDLDSSQNEQYQRNPFDDWPEDPESGDGFFGSQSPNLANRPDPESQGYTLLQDNDPPETGSTSADVDDAKEGHTEDNFNIFSTSPQRQDPTTGKVAAFSQVQGSISQGVAGFEFAGHQLVDPSNPVLQEMQTEMNVEHESGNTNPSDNKWWGVTENEEFNFGAADNQPDAFNSSSDPFQHISTQSEEDPFAQILESNGSNNPDPFASKGLFPLPERDF
jgi:hypothetical protein